MLCHGWHPDFGSPPEVGTDVVMLGGSTGIPVILKEGGTGILRSQRDS